MMSRLVIAALTCLGFGAGFLARMWTECARAVPPPPAVLGSEFHRSEPTADGAGQKPGSRSRGDRTVDRADLIADIEKSRPQIEAYRKRMGEIDAEFDRELVTLLNSDQRQRYEAQQKRYAERRLNRQAREAADPRPLSDEQILRLQQIPLFSALWTITVTSRLERLNRDLKLDESQMESVRRLLLSRRGKFIDLVDSAPPPTITLSLLASRAQKLAEPADSAEP